MPEEGKMRKTRFGLMKRLVARPMAADCEIMHFTGKGTSHTHPRVELAFCVYGVGVVVVGDAERPVEAGVVVEIPAGVPHHMRPAPGATMAMFIGYAS